MIADSNEADAATDTGRLPAAFTPELARTLNLPERAPGWDVGPERRIDDGRTLARMLGWASIGLGAVEVFAPERLADFLGVNGDSARVIRLMGVREIAQGVGILAADDPQPGIWARIGGDALDVGALGAALGRDDANRGAIALSLALVAGITALDVLCAKQLRSQPN